MWKLQHIDIGEEVYPDDYNALVDRLNRMVKVYGRNITGRLTERGYHIRVGDGGGGATTLRQAMIAEAPLPKPCVKINLMTSGVSGSSAVDCYLPFVNADRADMVSPPLALGDVFTVHESDMGVEISIAAYDSDRNYLINEQCSYDTKVWRAKVTDNLNHTPAVGAYWDQYTEWVDGVNALGVVREYGLLLYTCIQPTTSSQAPPDSEPDYWEVLTRITNPQWCFFQTFAGIKNVSV